MLEDIFTKKIERSLTTFNQIIAYKMCVQT